MVVLSKAQRITRLIKGLIAERKDLQETCERYADIIITLMDECDKLEEKVKELEEHLCPTK